MMSREKLDTIRTSLRESFKAAGLDVPAEFDRRIAELAHRGKKNRIEIETLMLFRDALVKETRRRIRRPTIAGRQRSTS